MKIPTTTAVAALLAALLPFAPVSCLEAPLALADTITLPWWWADAENPSEHPQWSGANPLHTFDDAPVGLTFNQSPNGWTFESGDPGQVGALLLWPSGDPGGVSTLFKYGNPGGPWFEVPLTLQGTEQAGNLQYYSASFTWQAAPESFADAQGWTFFGPGVHELFVDFQAVPEPSTAGLLAVGAMAVLRQRRRGL